MNDKNDNDSDNEEEGAGQKEPESNIIDFSEMAKLKHIREEQEKKWREEYKRQQEQAHPYAQGMPSSGQKEPMINLPPATKAMAAIFIGIHIILHFFLNPVQLEWVISHLAFIPASYTTDSFDLPVWSKAISPISYMFLHGNFMHLGMNTIMLLAFGSGMERQIGAKRFIIYFIACGLVALFIHFLLDMQSANPLIGASGGLSGLFAGMLVILHLRGMIGTGKYGLWPIIAIWIGITIAFGFIATPETIGATMDGSEAQIAWIAHLGGFLAGFLLLKPIIRMRI